MIPVGTKVLHTINHAYYPGQKRKRTTNIKQAEGVVVGITQAGWIKVRLGNNVIKACRPDSVRVK